MSKQVRWKEPECEVKTISPEPLQMVSTELHFGARHSAQSQSVNLNSDGSRVTVRVCGTDIEVCSHGDQVVLILKTPLGSMEHLLAQMTIGENLDHHLEFEPQEVHTWTVSVNDPAVTAIFLPDSQLEVRFWFNCVAFPPVVKTAHAETTFMIEPDLE
jgi:hypothetical protein